MIDLKEFFEEMECGIMGYTLYEGEYVELCDGLINYYSDSVCVKYLKFGGINLIELYFKEEGLIVYSKVYEIKNSEDINDIIKQFKEIYKNYEKELKSIFSTVKEIFDDNFHNFEEFIKDDLLEKRIELIEPYEFVKDFDYLYIFCTRFEPYACINRRGCSGKPFTRKLDGISGIDAGYAYMLCQILEFYEVYDKRIKECMKILSVRRVANRQERI